MSNEIMVSISCLTYNHEKYIRDCLDGFIMQKTNFKYEVLIHDDASTDGTADIIREYELKYPDIIKPIYQTENQYSKKSGVIRTVQYSRVKGKYIAWCEGDDYWTDPYKLQKQFDIMEANEEYSLSVHRVEKIRSIDNVTVSFFPDFTIKEKNTIEDILRYYSMKDWFFQLSSYFARTEYIMSYYDSLPEYTKFAAGDLAILLYLITKGDVHYTDEVMSRYRLATESSWTMKNKRNPERYIKHSINGCELFNLYDDYTEQKYHEIIKCILKKKYKNVYLNLKLYKYKDPRADIYIDKLSITDKLSVMKIVYRKKAVQILKKFVPFISKIKYYNKRKISKQ